MAIKFIIKNTQPEMYYNTCRKVLEVTSTYRTVLLDFPRGLYVDQCYMYYYHLPRPVVWIIELFSGDASHSLWNWHTEGFCHEQVTCVNHASTCLFLRAVLQVWSMPCCQPSILYSLPRLLDPWLFYSMFGVFVPSPWRYLSRHGGNW